MTFESGKKPERIRLRCCKNGCIVEGDVAGRVVVLRQGLHQGGFPGLACPVQQHHGAIGGCGQNLGGYVTPDHADNLSLFILKINLSMDDFQPFPYGNFMGDNL
jgi:hypothetical protein